MSSSLELLRTDVASAITNATGIPAYDHVPERFTPPAAVVVPDQPYVSTDDTTMCPWEYRIRLRVVLLAARGTNAAAAGKLDGHIVDVIRALEDAPAGGYELGTVAEPVDVELNGATYIGTTLTLSTLATMENTP